MAFRTSKGAAVLHPFPAGPRGPLPWEVQVRTKARRPPRPLKTERWYLFPAPSGQDPSQDAWRRGLHPPAFVAWTHHADKPPSPSPPKNSAMMDGGEAVLARGRERSQTRAAPPQGSETSPRRKQGGARTAWNILFEQEAQNGDVGGISLESSGLWLKARSHDRNTQATA
jgi:hypothetical protein